MKPIPLFFALIGTVIIPFKVLATDTATHIIGQGNNRYNYGIVKEIEKPAYAIMGKPFVDPITNRAPSHKKKNSAPQPVTSTHIVHFNFGSSELSGSEEQKLYPLVTIIGKKPVISVTGYTSSEGSFEVNDRLSWNRAQTVAAWLRKQGIKVLRISGKPKCCYVSTDRPAENRRVEIVFSAEINQTKQEVLHHVRYFKIH